METLYVGKGAETVTVCGMEMLQVLSSRVIHAGFCGSLKQFTVRDGVEELDMPMCRELRFVELRAGVKKVNLSGVSRSVRHRW